MTIPGLIAGIPSMGSYEAVIREAEKVLADPESNLASISEAIEKDPDLTSRLLRLGNSSFYAFPQRIDTVQEAITLIGIQQIYDLLLATNIIDLFAGVSSEWVTMESFWLHSLACGVVARMVALDRKLPKPDKYFVAGLLHDVGRMVLFSRIPEVVAQIFTRYQQERCLLTEAETHVLGFNHEDIGSELLRNWGYPIPLVEGIGYHHYPAAAGPYQMEASLIHVADFLTHVMDLGTTGETFIPPLKLPAWNKVNYPLSQMESLVKAADEQIQIVEAVFLDGA